MEGISQIAALAVTAALCAAVVKKQTPEMALAVTLCAVAVILSLAIGVLAPVKGLMDALADKAGLRAAVLTPVVTTVGISLLTRVTAELCRDGQESGLAAAVEIGGSGAALLACLPLFEAVLQMILELL